MYWETAHAQDVGGREEQQDRVAAFEGRNGREFLLVVADGAGGHTGGALAAQDVIDAAAARWRGHRRTSGEPRSLLDGICQDAHRRISARGGTGRNAPRSTCVVLHVDGDTAHWANVGDSRAYHFRHGRVAARSKDHSVAQMLVDMGRIQEDEMATHPDQNRLTQSLGGDGSPTPDLGWATVRANDGFLLCSDGLWERVTSEEMAAALTATSLDTAAASIVRQAAQRGGSDTDNVTVALARPRSGRAT